MNKIKPIFRLVGSKYRMLDWLFEKMKIEKYTKFIDLFGGTGIVGVNVKKSFKNIQTVLINDFDNILEPLDIKHAVLSQVCFNGFGSVTERALSFFSTKINNGYFENIKAYKNVLKNCKVTHYEATDFLNRKKEYLKEHQNELLIYMDIPYYDKKHKNSCFYKNKLNIDYFLEVITKLNEDIPGLSMALSIDDSNQKVLNKLSHWTKHTKQISKVNASRSGVIKKGNEYLLIWGEKND
ncbi:DNA adenine methylase [Mycoplasmopsis lipofaciens]|uniref:DNA adenine methylase n=1 Tax=Mycoplasmopsis lipofaciens TaxID=114884 RepID=UPI000489BA73|nr:DNA adenine methylase [Mycoplasmopsis lipofaciens]